MSGYGNNLNPKAVFPDGHAHFCYYIIEVAAYAHAPPKMDFGGNRGLLRQFQGHHNPTRTANKMHSLDISISGQFLHT